MTSIPMLASSSSRPQSSSETTSTNHLIQNHNHNHNHNHGHDIIIESSTSRDPARPRARTSLPPSNPVPTHLTPRAVLGASSATPTSGGGRGRGTSASRREDSAGLGFASGHESTPGPTSAKMNGNGNGTSADAKPKKKKRKGWKGWAMVVEDEDGNVLEIRDGPEVEADADKNRVGTQPAGMTEATGGQASYPGDRAAMSMDTDGADEPILQPALRFSTGPIVGAGLSKEMERGLSNGTADSPLTVSSPVPTLPEESLRHKSSSPLPMIQAQPSAKPLSQSRKPSPILLKPVEQSNATSIIPKKRPRQSASATPNPPTDSPSTSTTAVKITATTTNTATAPRQSLPKSKPLRPLNHAQPTRAQPSRQPPAAQPLSASGTPGPALGQVIDEHPLPLPKAKATRAGMGEAHETPAESAIRGEALFIIQNAEKHREIEAARLTPPPTGDGEFAHSATGTDELERARAAGLETNGNADGLASSSSALAASGQPPTPPHSDSVNGTENNLRNGGPSSTPNTVVPKAGNRTTIRIAHPTLMPISTTYHHVHIEQPEEDFEAQFARVQEAYENGIKYRTHPDAPCERSVPVKGLDDANPPEFEREQSPTIVLVPPEPKKLQPSNEIEKAHRDGYEGLPESLEVDAQGFVDNVRDNIRNIMAYYFPQPSVNRDAFLEKIGRGLADMGWQLTDSSDGAIA